MRRLVTTIIFFALIAFAYIAAADQRSKGKLCLVWIIEVLRISINRVFYETRSSSNNLDVLRRNAHFLFEHNQTFNQFFKKSGFSRVISSYL